MWSGAQLILPSPSPWGLCLDPFCSICPALEIAHLMKCTVHRALLGCLLIHLVLTAVCSVSMSTITWKHQVRRGVYTTCPRSWGTRWRRNAVLGTGLHLCSPTETAPVRLGGLVRLQNSKLQNCAFYDSHLSPVFGHCGPVTPVSDRERRGCVCSASVLRSTWLSLSSSLATALLRLELRNE